MQLTLAWLITALCVLMSSLSSTPTGAQTPGQMRNDSATALKSLSIPTLTMSYETGSLDASVERARTLRPDLTHRSFAVDTGLLTFDHPGVWTDAVVSFFEQDCG